jgi:hypothetical protein
MRIRWGTTEIIATNISYSRQAQAEVDMTSMESRVELDPENTGRRRVRKSIEFAVMDHGELTIEFVGPGGFNDTHVGLKKTLTVTGTGTGVTNAGGGGLTVTGSAAQNFPNNVKAFLTAISVQAAAGDLVRGNCTFRISDT